MKLSIVTISYNNLYGLKSTAASVFSQTWKDFEWIVIDGGSTDGTKEYIESLERKPDFWCSEKDAGIYDAQNKGIRIAKGEYVCCMNSGDTFCDEKTLQKVFSYKPTGDIVYGDWKRVFPNKEELRHSPKKMPPYFFFYNHNNICHQAMFVKTRLLQKSGFDLSYRIFADWAKWRQLMLENCSFEYVPVAVCNFEANTGTCEQDSLRKKKEYEMLYNQIPSEVRKHIIDMNCDIDIALIGFFPPNNGTIIWRLYFLQKALEEKGYKVVVLTKSDKQGKIRHTIKRSKKIILCRPSMDKHGFMAVQYCIAENKPFIIDLDDALFHDNISHDGCFMSGLVSRKDITRGYNNVADCYNFAEFITVSTPKIGEFLQEKYNIKSILLPNKIDPSLCKKKDYKEHYGLNLLYSSGTATHLHDLSTIFVDLLSFLKRHQDVTLTIIGDSIDTKDIPWASDRVRKVPYLGFNDMLNEYAKYDLILVPLAQGEFNDAKSNIKYIEGGSVGVPVIASDRAEFRNAIVDGKNGYLFHNDFLEKMEYIYAHKDDLVRVGETAFQDVMEKHSQNGDNLPAALIEWLNNY